MSETHLTNDIGDDEINLQNYSVLRCDSTSRHTGGVICYVRNGIQYRIIDKLTVDMKVWSLCCEISTSEFKEAIAIFYRSPSGSESEFCNLFSNWIDKILDSNINIVILGDFNIDLMNNNNTYTKAFNNILIINNCKQIINKPTRITRTSRSLVDFVICPIEKNVWADTKLDLKIGDHESVLVKINVSNKKSNKETKYIDIFSYKRSEFRVLLRQKCNQINNIHDFNEMSSELEKSLNDCVKKGLKRKRINENENRWFSEELNAMKNQKIYAFQRASVINNETEWLRYTNIRNRYKNKLQHAKKNFICNKIQLCRDQKSMWRTIKTLVLKNKKEQINEVQFNDILEKDSKSIANKFNSFFIESINKISNSIPLNSSPIHLTRISVIQNVFKFRVININELRLICTKMNKKNALNLNMKMILESFDIIGPFLIHIINESFIRGEFPKNLKESIVIPIPKETGAKSCEKFRPVNMMPILEKIVEKCAYEQFYKYVEDNSLLIENQSGFRPSHSCESSLNWLIMNFKQHIHDGQKIISLFLDFQRAFETIDRLILIEKLSKYGVKGNELEWFKSYLTNRSQKTNINGEQSSAQLTTFGVPQGTILGPLLFLIYINDIGNALSYCQISLFADDALMYINGKHIDLIEELMKKDLENLCDWLKANKLKTNASKTKCMVINSDYRVNLEIENTRIEQVNEIKYLGIKLDNKLNFKNHIQYTIGKISKKVGFLKRIRKNINTMCAINIYNTIIKPHFDFCSTILFLGTNDEINRMQILQNKAMRTITRSSFHTSTNWLLSCLKWLSVRQCIILNVLTFVFKMKHNMMPNYLTSRLQYVQDVQPYSLRNNCNFRFNFYRDSRTQNMIFYKGLKLFNDLPSNIKNETNLKRFKKELIINIRRTVPI